MGTIRAREIVELERYARLERGLFTAADAARHGVSRAAVSHHCKTGRWGRIFPGVYVMRSVEESRGQLLRGALLWGGPTSTLSHLSAVALMGLDGARHPPPELWTPRHTSAAGILSHRGVVPLDEQ